MVNCESLPVIAYCLITNYCESTEFVYKCEPLSEIGSCIVSNLLFFALEDGAFKVVKSLDDLEKLMRSATGPIRLSYDDKILGKPILRSYNPHQIQKTSQSSSWTVSDTRALTYNGLYNLLVKLGYQAGLECTLHFLSAFTSFSYPCCSSSASL